MNSADIQRLLREIEEKDQSTAAHTWRVVLYMRALAELGGVEGDVLSRIARGAALHDLGKLDVPTAILQKPGPLTDEEFEIVKRHPATGYDRLVAMGESDSIVLNLVRHHHEQWGGGGYPDGLRGEEIPIGARFFAIIDAFDALTSMRPYRQEVGRDAAERAIKELQNGIGTRYCGSCVALFNDLYRSGRVDWVLTYYNDASDATFDGLDESI